MRGKGRARIVLFATVGIDACVWLNGCATAGNPDDGHYAPLAADDAGGGSTVLESRESGAMQSTSGNDATRGQESIEASSATVADDAGAPAPDAADDASAASDDESGAGVVTDAGAARSDAQFDADGYYEEYPEASSTGADASQDATLDAATPPDASSFDATVDAAPLADAGADTASIAAGDAGDAACGGCATGFSCGPGAYCVSSTGVPEFGHVYVIVMEQQSLSAIQGSASAPYINLLIASSALAVNYTAPDHPSLPNYFELTSGDSQGVQCDCAPGGTPTCTAPTCNGLSLPGSCTCPQPGGHLGDEFDTVGVPWREYAEGMGSPCNIAGADGGADFAPSHVPFLYYDDVYTGADGRCVQRVRDYGDFAADLAAGSYAFAMISPNTCHDMQTICTGNQVLQGDDWLSINVPPILATPGFAADGRDALFIVWEEAGTDIGTPPVPLIVVSPLARATTTDTAYTHYSLLSTIEDGFGVARLGASAGAAPVADVWR
jgi:phosphatidylinositol-3-phosphatase